MGHVVSAMGITGEISESMCGRELPVCHVICVTVRAPPRGPVCVATSITGGIPLSLQGRGHHGWGT